MATLPNPTAPKFPDVYQIETSDPVQGGPNGVSNKSTKDLVERTQYLNLNKANITTKIVAGNGLTGGGTLGSDTTVTLGTPGALTDKSTNAVTDTGHTHSIQKSSTAVAGIVQLNDTLTSDSAALALTAKQGKALKSELATLGADKAATATKIVAGNGLTGGGTLGADTTVMLGTPGALTDKSTNTVTTTGHTHSLQKSSTAVAGIVQLNDTLTSDSTTLALTAKQGLELSVMIEKLLPIKAFSGQDYIRIPDRPGGLIVQWQELLVTGIPYDRNVTKDFSFPIPFPNKLLSIATQARSDYMMISTRGSGREPYGQTLGVSHRNPTTNASQEALIIITSIGY